MKIIIFRMLYPNDSVKQITPHQHFLCTITNKYIEVYTISSILGKEKRVFGQDTKEENELINANEIAKYGFKVPSFIDCSKLYHIEIDETIDLSLLDTREVSDELANRVTERAKRLKLKNKHKIYNITIEELKKYNLKIIKKWAVC